MANSENTKLEWIRTGGVLGAAIIGVVGGWLASNANSSAKSAAEESTRKFELTHFASQTHWDISTCTQKLADGLVKAGLPYDNRGQRGIYLKIGKTYSFAYCVPDTRDESKVSRVVIGASYLSDPVNINLFQDEWKKLAFTVEGIVNEGRPN